MKGVCHMDQGTVVSIVIIVVVLALIGALIAISYVVKGKQAQYAEKPAEAEEPAAEEAEEPAAAEAAEEPAEEPEEEEEAEESEEEAAEEEAEEPEEEEEAEEEEEPVAEEEEQPAEEPAEQQPAPAKEIAVSASPAEGDVAGEALTVRDMSPALRAALGVVGAEHDAEIYSVRYSYSFLARLVLAADDVKGYYSELIDEIASYKKMRVRASRRQQNVNIGRQRVAAILFKGKKLCLALALDPAEYAGTKYRGKDASAMKRFAATPMLFKVDSARKIKYAKYLIARLAEQNGLEQGKVVPVKGDEVPALTRDELIGAKEIKVTGKRLS